MGKEILFDDAATKALRAGVNKAADAIGSTMGAAGRTVVIYDKSKLTREGVMIPAKSKVTKDGVTVADSVVPLDDEIENIGALFIREASATTYLDAGDGTTQTAVLAQSMINDGIKQVTAGSNPMEIKRGMEKAVGAIVKRLKEISSPVDPLEGDGILNVATTSANNDKAIGELIAEAYRKIGKGGLLHIENSDTAETRIEIVEGYEMPRGYISPDFGTDEKKRAVHKDALILVADYTIHTMKDVYPLLQQMEKANLLSHPLIIIAQDYEGEFYSSMLINHRNGQIRNCLVKSPITYRREHLEDIATMTGATVIRDENGLKIQNANLTHLGSAEKVVITEFTTTIFGGGGKKDKIEDLKNSVKVQMDEIKDDQLKAVWERRLAKISGCIAIIKVGASTDTEQGEKVARVDDACRAVRSAMEEGTVVGGGVALIRCEASAKDVAAIGDEAIGVKIVRDACFVPLERMLKNAGLSNDIVKKVVSEEDTDGGNYGYDIKVREFGNLSKKGIVDPTKVVRCALENAVSVSATVITALYYVVEKR